MAYSKSEKLIFSEIQFRHGARSPISYNEKFLDMFAEKWDNDGELTAKGQRMEFILGLKNRKKYIYDKKLISEKYDPHEILVISSPVNRTIMSVNSFLQGFYPSSQKLGEILTDSQIETAYPPGNITDEKIIEEIKNLNDSALPNYMTIPPVYVISPKERRLVVYSSEGCSKHTNVTRDQNTLRMDSIKNIEKEFNEKYSKQFNDFYKKEDKNNTYNFDWVGLMCDTFVSDYTEGRELKEFKDVTGITGEKMDEFVDFCWKAINVNFRDNFMGDEEHKIIKLDVSKILRELIYYMKLRVDADISGEQIDTNATNYQKPKMIIISGHDTTITAQYIFMILYFMKDGDVEKDFQYPKYSSETSFEVSRDDVNDPSKLTYADYKVRYFYNDELKYEKPMNEFIEIIEKNVWSDEQVDEFCDEYLEGGNPKNQNKTLYIIIAVLCGLIVALIIVIIILCVKVCSNKKSNIDNSGLVPPDEQK